MKKATTIHGGRSASFARRTLRSTPSQTKGIVQMMSVMLSPSVNDAAFEFEMFARERR